MIMMKRRALLVTTVLSVLLFFLGMYVYIPSALSAQDEWRKEFDEICGKTQDAMTLPAEELKSLSERCDRLKPQIEKLDESQKKVYLKRLQMCKDLFVYVLKSRETKP